MIDASDNDPLAPLGARRLAALIVIVIVFTLNALWSLCLVPISQGPDERDHLDYISFLAHEKRLPDPTSENVGQLQHPPLSYALGALLFGALREDASADADPDPVTLIGRRTTCRPELSLADAWGVPPRTGDERRDADLATRSSAYYMLRIPSVLLGVATVLMLFASLRYVMPRRPTLAVLATAAVTLTPHLPYHFSTVSNDPWITFMGSLITWQVLRARHRGTLATTRTMVVLAALLGAAFLIKLQAIGVAVFAAACVWRTGRGRLTRLGLLIAGPLLLASWWHLRQVMLQGSLLPLANHADFRPDLFRLEAFHPVLFLDVVEELVRSFFGQFGQDGIAPHPIYALVCVGIATMALLGACLRRREEDDADPAVPRGACLLAVGVLLASLLFSNLTYYHFNGRYLFAVLGPLAILFVAGIRRLTGRHAVSLLTAVVIWNVIFLFTTSGIVMANRCSVAESKFSRGAVVAYFDCGHRYFDQESAGGWVRRHDLLSLPQRTMRWAHRGDEDRGLVYRFDVPDVKKRYQLRVRYPSPSADGRDGAGPTANTLLADSWILHGPHTHRSELGEFRYPLAGPITADGKVEVWWENHVPGAQLVDCAEIWLEEAWISVVEPPSLSDDDRWLNVSLANIDEEPHVATLYCVQGPTRLGELKIDLAPQTTRSVAIPIESTATLVREALRLKVVDHGLGAWAHTKLVLWSEGTRHAGHPSVVDIRTLAHRPGAAPGTPLARVPLPRLPHGNYRIGISHPAAHDPMTSGAVRLQCEGLIFGEDIRRAPLEGGLAWSFVEARHDLTAAGIPEKNEVLVITAGKDTGRRVDLDRLIVEWIPDHEARAHSYEIE